MTKKKEKWGEEFDRRFSGDEFGVIEARGASIKSFISQQIKQAQKEILKKVKLKNPYPEPLGNPDLGYPDDDKDKREGYEQAKKDLESRYSSFKK